MTVIEKEMGKDVKIFVSHCFSVIVISHRVKLDERIIGMKWHIISLLL